MFRKVLALTALLNVNLVEGNYFTCDWTRSNERRRYQYVHMIGRETDPGTISMDIKVEYVDRASKDDNYELDLITTYDAGFTSIVAEFDHRGGCEASTTPPPTVLEDDIVTDTPGSDRAFTATDFTTTSFSFASPSLDNERGGSEIFGLLRNTTDNVVVACCEVRVTDLVDYNYIRTRKLDLAAIPAPTQ